ncbi:hypothetical protein AQS8620_00408 [Aquimixticola soesokkakensis]|uniref:HIG1 domain-containing protein n=1 Tax=Aquimixticola soesokkakensis TaxID=1519096 RepID=A0A1Y5RKP5_9RHOB|nr:twin transmembrane helix small protein [Aquimixticola soesokkakensis]SLN18785.1 hypothetical protein AQS8620_00408 [Aquimixticola soesokkakensis]
MASQSLFTIVILGGLAVLVILMIGLGSFGKGGDFDRKNANRLMRYRVGAQALVVLLIVIFMVLRGSGN